MQAQWLLVALWLQATALPAQETLDQARVYYERSQQDGLSAQERLDWLEKSVETHPTYKAQYDLGKLRRARRDTGGALESFEAAFAATDQKSYLAQAAYQVGVTHYELGHFVEARRWLRRSLGLEAHPEVRSALRELELSRKDTVLSAEEILRELTVTRSFEVSQAELRVNFELNDARLDETGLRQAEELGRALTDPAAPSGTLVLLGHTDLLCPRSRPDDPGCDAFNRDLSERRAETVGHYLASRFRMAAEEIRILGCGRGYPLSYEGSDDDHYLNRRVVVMFHNGGPVNGAAMCANGAGLF